MEFVALFALGGLFLLALPMLSARVLVLLILVVRCMAEYGISTGSKLWPAGELVTGLALLCVVAAAVRVGAHRVGDSGVFVWSGLYLAFSIFVATFYFGFDFGVLEAGAVLISAFCLFWLGRVYVRDRGVEGARYDLAVAIAVVATAFILLFVVDPGGSRIENGRAAGMFSHPNAAGSFFAIVLVFAVHCSSRSYRGIYLYTATVTFISLVLTGSINALISAGIGLLALLITSRVSIFRKASISFVAVATTWAVTTQISDIRVRLLQLSDSDVGSALQSGVSQNSFEWRLINWQSLLRIAQDHVIFGSGLGTTQSLVTPYNGPPHSAPIQVIVEGGIVGFIALSVLLIALWRRGLALKRAGSALFGLYSAIVATVLVNGLASNLLTTGTALYAFALILAFCVQGDRMHRSSQSGAAHTRESAVAV